MLPSMIPKSGSENEYVIGLAARKILLKNSFVLLLEGDYFYFCNFTLIFE